MPSGPGGEGAVGKEDMADALGRRCENAAEAKVFRVGGKGSALTTHIGTPQ